MINELTKKQSKQLIKCRDKAFRHATSTKINRPKAEKWALRLTNGVLKDPQIYWEKSTKKAIVKYNSINNDTNESLIDSLSDDLRENLWDSLSDDLSEKLNNKLWGRLNININDSLIVGLRRNIRNSPIGTLGESLWHSLYDSGWIAFYSFAEKIGVKYSEDSEKLKCYRKLLKHCFAMYITQKHIILVDKPKSVQIKNKKLIKVEFE